MLNEQLKDRGLDLASLTPEHFEDLICAIFEAKKRRQDNNQSSSIESLNYKIISISQSGRGHDQGRDILVITHFGDCIASHQFKWIVQCKHKAASGRSIVPQDFDTDFSFPDVVRRHNANGYLLIGSTPPSTSLQSLFETFTASEKNNYQFIIWRPDRIYEEVISLPEVQQRFFPGYFEWSQGLLKKDRVMEWADEQGIEEESLSSLFNREGTL